VSLRRASEVFRGPLSGAARPAVRGRPMSWWWPQDEPRLYHDEEDMMMSYSSPEFVDAHARYRRERLASDWQGRRAGHTSTTFVPHPAWAAATAVATLRLRPRRQRHA
jgi:hypothetical protein